MKFKKSLELLDTALEYIPNGTQTAGKCYNQWPLGAAPIFARSGKGCKIKCVDGNEYIDMVAAFGPTILGYSHPKVNKAISKQLKKGVIFSLSHEIEAKLAKMIVDIVPSAEMVKFAKTGTDACNAAVRMVRSYTGKQDILLFNEHYHGWGDTFAAASIRHRGSVTGIDKAVTKVDYNDLNAVEDALKTGRFAAVMMEPVSLTAPNPGYLEGIRVLCDKYNALLVFDEIITGFRWSLGGAQEYYGVTPDLSLFSKAMANGMPISAIVGRKDVMEEANKIFFSGTFFGETLSIAAAVATIKELKRKNTKAYDYIWTHGKHIKRSFDAVRDRLNLNAAMVGLPPRYNIRFYGDQAHGANDLFKQEMIKRGVLVGSQFYVTYAHKPKHLDKVTQAIEESLEIVSMGVQSNGIDKLLKVIKKSETIFKDQVTS